MTPLLMVVEQLVELELTRVDVALIEITSQYNFYHYKSQVSWPRIEPGP